jgi:hypothetical protein
VDGKGFFYVADNGNHAILKFDPEGRYISRFGYEGHPAGKIDTDFSGIAVDGLGQLWATIYLTHQPGVCHDPPGGTPGRCDASSLPGVGASRTEAPVDPGRLL